MRLSSQCVDCAAKDAVIAELMKLVGRQTPMQPFIQPTPYTPYQAPRFDTSKCPCNPALGGSGVCGCVMSGPTITCSVQ